MKIKNVLTPLRFVLIGENTLALKCAEIARAGGHSIIVIVSKTPQLYQWANKHNIKYFLELDKEAINELSFCEFDFLLSIDNGMILDSKILSLPKRLAINYHDSLLPRYAGLNATAWAILNNESSHGITWHVIDKGVDTGDILLQRRFPIKEADTTLGLNTTCYEQAIDSFPCLLEQMESGGLERKAQDLSLRTYFSAAKVVENNGFVDFSNTSDHIDRLYRALYYGPYSNNLCLLKIYIGGEFYILNHLKVCDSISSNRSGMLVSMEKDCLTISTKSQDIRIGLVTLTGGPINHVMLTHILHVNIGDSLPLPNIKYLKRYFLKHRKYKLNETFWKSRLKKCIVTNLPMEASRKQDSRLVPVASYTYDQPAELVVPALILTLSKIQEGKPFTLWLSKEATYNEVEYLKNTYTCEVPFTFNASKNKPCGQLVKEMSKQLTKLMLLAPFELEIFARDRESEKALKTKDILILFKNSESLPEYSLNYKLVFIFDEDGGGINLMAADSFLLNNTDKHLLENILSYNNNLIDMLKEKPLCSFNKLKLLDVRQQERMLLEFNNTSKDVGSNTDVFSMIDAHASKKADNVAVLFGEDSFSYSKLLADVEVFAKKIRKNISGGNEFIPIVFKRSYEMIVSMLAVLKEGHAYVPLNWKWPAARMVEILHDCGASFFISSDVINFENIKIYMRRIDSLCLKEDQVFFITLSSDPAYKRTVLAKDIAYLVYTSGTTGKPKAVVVTHKNVVNYQVWFSKEFALRKESVVDFSSSIAFDISVACTLVPLMQGSAVAICPELSKLAPEKYLNHLKTKKVSHVECTPGYMSSLLCYPDRIKDLYDLKWLLLGAEKLVKNDVQAWMDLCPHHNLVNEYGPTECTVAVSKYLITRESLRESGASIPIGKPGYNNNFVVLDEDGHVCPVGVPGELYVTGSSVASGYLDTSPALNKSFDPGKLDGIFPHKGKCYATGDVVRWLCDGNVDYLGRRDRQVKIMGCRVELDAINDSLVRHEGIRQCHLVVEKNGSNNKWITAYIVLEDPDSLPLKKSSLKNYLKKILPHYMIPSRYLVISAMPLCPVSEKIEESSLRDYVLYELGSNNVLAANVENTLVRMVSDIMGGKIIRPDMDLFDLGMDSLMAIHLMAQIEARYHIKFSLAKILENTSIAKLEICIRSLLNGKNPCLQSNFHPAIGLKKTGDISPLFLIHPLGGGVFWYRNIPKYILPQMPVYALQDPSLEQEGHFFFSSIKEMASSYLKIIKAIQPTGPYFIAGASFGATVAVEIAQQLEQENESISFLGLLDGWAKYPFIGEEIIEKSANANRYGYEISAAWHVTLQKQRTHLLRSYVMPIIRQKITLFKAGLMEEPFIGVKDASNYWLPYATQPITVYDVPGTHSSMFDSPNVEALSNFLNREIVSYLDEPKQPLFESSVNHEISS